MNSAQLTDFLSQRDAVIDYIYKKKDSDIDSDLEDLAVCLLDFKEDLHNLSQKVIFSSTDDIVSIYDYYLYIYKKKIICLNELTEKMLYGCKYQDNIINFNLLFQKLEPFEDKVLNIPTNIICDVCTKDQYDCTCFNLDTINKCHICDGYCDCGRINYLKTKNLGPFSKL